MECKNGNVISTMINILFLVNFLSFINIVHSTPATITQTNREMYVSFEEEVPMILNDHLFNIEVSVGSPGKQVKFTLDTGADTSTLKKSSFDTMKSSSYSEGANYFEDVVKLGSLTQSKRKMYYSIDDQETKFSLLSLSASSEPNSTNILSLLKDEGIINRRIFSFFKSNTKWNFYVGDFPSEVEANIEKTSSCKITSELSEIKEAQYKNKWICDLTHGLIGTSINNNSTQQFNQTFEIDGYAAIFSAYRYIRSPKRFLSIYKTQLFDKLNCEEKSEGDETFFICEDSKSLFDEYISTVSFVLGGFLHAVPPGSLLQKYENGKLEVLLRFKENSDIWILGQAFLTQFTSVFDMDKKQIAFYGGIRKNFTKEVQEWEDKIYQYQTERMAYLSWFSIGLFFIVVIGLFFVIFSRIIKRIRMIKDRRTEDIRPLVNIRT